ncbi:hypothetical protein GQ53DRAFT_688840 [Thozetella sp. PMI_491]|nr:hypothetical protein GQ53DRAFT_688840 [Thozetella sp. PMI_491]
MPGETRAPAGGGTRDASQKKSRSRTGCLTCRRRHIRCDEMRPSCAACLNSKRRCEYVAIAPLKERRQGPNSLLPGQQVPWVCQISIQVDPFDALPIRMPFRSKELLHYFHQAGVAFGVAPDDPKEDCLAQAALDQHSLRNALVIAGMHYAWNTGSLKAHSPAFFHHKVETIRAVNSWLADCGPKDVNSCTRLICTLSFIEGCLGNMEAAETHLNGLMSFLDLREQDTQIVTDRDAMDNELANRYLLMVACFLQQLKTRLRDFLSLYVGDDAERRLAEMSSEEVMYFTDLKHKAEVGGLELRLKTIRHFPHFFNLPPGPFTLQKVDATPLIEGIRTVTDAVDLRNSTPTRTPVDAERLWAEGGPTRLFVTFVELHRLSISLDGKAPGVWKHSDLHSSWNGASGAAGLYFISVLEISNGGLPMERRLLRRIVSMIKKDVDETAEVLSTVPHSTPSDFWLWKVYGTAFALDAAERAHRLDGRRGKGHRSTAYGGKEPDIASLLVHFERCVLAWSRATAITDWTVAKSVLARIVWPKVLPTVKERCMEAMWDRVTSKSLNSELSKS